MNAFGQIGHVNGLTPVRNISIDEMKNVTRKPMKEMMYRNGADDVASCYFCQQNVFHIPVLIASKRKI